jgi:hypothetical protein
VKVFIRILRVLDVAGGSFVTASVFVLDVNLGCAEGLRGRGLKGYLFLTITDPLAFVLQKQPQAKTSKTTFKIISGVELAGAERSLLA